MLLIVKISSAQSLQDLIEIYNKNEREEVLSQRKVSSLGFLGLQSIGEEVVVGLDSQGECVTIHFKIENAEIILERLSRQPKLFLIKELSQGDTLYNQGFLAFLDTTILYVSFQNEPVSHQYGPYRSKTEGSVESVHSISVLRNDLKNDYTFFYEKGNLLYISDFIYEEDTYSHTVVKVKAGCEFTLLQSDILHKISRSKDLKPVSLLIPQVHSDYVAYAWLLEDKYLNELFNKNLNDH